MGPGPDQIFFTWLSLGLGFEKFPLRIPNFSIFFPLGQKNLIWPGQKLPGSKTGWHIISCELKMLCRDGP